MSELCYDDDDVEQSFQFKIGYMIETHWFEVYEKPDNDLSLGLGTRPEGGDRSKSRRGYETSVWRWWWRWREQDVASRHVQACNGPPLPSSLEAVAARSEHLTRESQGKDCAMAPVPRIQLGSYGCHIEEAWGSIPPMRPSTCIGSLL